ncbi:MAG: hypothetical protein IJC55_03635 [Clostridia bacterium]|nr:hypothetical protein [Clostridia bacterium]
MKKTNVKTISKRVVSALLCLALMIACVPLSFGAAATGNPYYDRTVDPNTMDGWKSFFDRNDLTTVNAGGVWTDKSVFTSVDGVDEFEHAGITMLNDDENFLTALSAIAANKEVVGYSTIPTDTVLILDVSGSMRGSEAALVQSANQAIKKLLDTNKNNRVGVVLYSASSDFGTSTYAQSVTRLLPIDRYTLPENNTSYLVTSTENRVTSISVSNRVRIEGQTADPHLDNSKSVQGGTYIQAGLWEAMKMLTAMDTTISDNNWQSGKQRMPIVVLMSDGAPSTGTSFYDNVENSYYTSNNRRYGSNVGNGDESNMTEGQAFLTQLTASYVKTRIENHYKAEDEDARSLFYTLGFNIGDSNVAKSVMDPDGSTLTDSLWSAYNNLTGGTLNIRVKDTSRNGNPTTVSIAKNSYVTDKSYVDEYFAASAGQLGAAFEDLVEEIIIQSRYYPTHLEGGSPDFSGYVSFTDQLGDHMEVKDIKGILLGAHLYSGQQMAHKLIDTGEGGLGTLQGPTELGNEFIHSVKIRLGIPDTADAQMLVQRAWNAKQLYYDAQSGAWSNYIGWYSKADGTYAGFWDGTQTQAVPDGAVYRIKSYGFLGETVGNIKNSDMMYMTVQVRTDLATGKQSVIWKIPASLVPMVTYSVSLNGTNVDTATDISIQVTGAATPIRLLFETGLRSGLNQLNITSITDAAHVDKDGVTRKFWNNYFDISAAEHDDHITALAEFTPNKDNERFYYTSDSVVYKEIAKDQYQKVAQGELSAGGTYYHRRYIFTDDSSVPIFKYEPLSAATLAIVLQKGWQANFKVSNTETGAYIVPQGTVTRELTPHNRQKADEGAATESARMIFHPYITTQNEISYVDMNLGNNGLLKVTPAQGIKLSKTIDVYENGTSDVFKFRITVSGAGGTLESWITPLDEVPTVPGTELTLQNGVHEVTLKAGQTFWLIGLPAGVSYTIEEISENEDYKIKSVHVNGNSTGTRAVGSIVAHQIDEVDFVNTALGEGDLVITKQVEDTNGQSVDVADSVKFTAQVALTDADGDPVAGSFPASTASGLLNVPASGIFTVTLAEGESLILHKLPEGTRYTVTEPANTMPQGFRLNAQKSILNGIVDVASNDQALLVNTYDPLPANGSDVTVVIEKAIDGNRTDFNPGESYSFTLERIDLTRAAGTTVGSFTVSYDDAQKSKSMVLKNEVYPAAGSYYYRITEATGSIGGITYDTAERRFRVDVADADKNGDLEIVSVVNELNTVVSGAYTVTASFTNVYRPVGSAQAVIRIKKSMANYALNGFQFALYDSADIANAEEIVRSTVTDAQGNASFTLTYAANRATVQGVTDTFYLAEINTQNPNITYSDAVYRADITVKDNRNGTISATPVITPLGETQAVAVADFTNVYTPSASAYVTVSGNKTVSDNRALNANEFSFKLTPTDPAYPMPASDTVKNAADGSFVFDAIKFDNEGDFTYTVTELDNDRIHGFSYDRSVYTVFIQVRDNGNAKLVATVSLGKENSSAQNIVFHNIYDPDDATVTLAGDKLLTGKPIQKDEFSFTLTPVTQGAPMPKNATVKNDANGRFSFGDITYTAAGTYRYQLAENAFDNDNYDFDRTVYTVTVTVRDNSEGVLTASVALQANGVNATAPVFRNGYVPDPIQYDIHAKFGGTKQLNGRPLKDGEFEFMLVNAINGAQIGETVKNAADGSFRFPAVLLPEVGTYHYKILEVIGDEAGITYDTTVFHAALKVEQDAVTGELYVVPNSEELYAATVVKEDVGGTLTEVTHFAKATAIVLKNAYAADPDSAVIRGNKLLTGRSLSKGEFRFDLYSVKQDPDGKAVKDKKLQTAENAADGTFVFEGIEITAPGRYQYVVIEDASDALEYVTYDTTEYLVTVTAVDNMDGTMSLTYAYATKDGNAETLTFTNTYTPPAPPEQSPQTGDCFNPIVWCALACVSGLGLLTTVLATRRKKHPQAD